MNALKIMKLYNDREKTAEKIKKAVENAEKKALNSFFPEDIYDSDATRNRMLAKSAIYNFKKEVGEFLMKEFGDLL